MILGAVGLAIAVLGLTLIIQSRILLDSDQRLVRLSKQLKTLAYFVAIPIGIILSIIGLVMPTFMESFVSVGVNFIILSITMLIQSQALTNIEDKRAAVGRNIRVWAYICTGVGFVAVIVLLVRTISSLWLC